MVAVKLEQTNYGYVETAYFANVEHISKSELNNIVSSDSPLKELLKQQRNLQFTKVIIGLFIVMEFGRQRLHRM